MVKKWAFITLTVSDLAAAPSHSLHRTLAALPGPGSAHHVALSSPRRPQLTTSAPFSRCQMRRILLAAPRGCSARRGSPAVALGGGGS